MSATPTPWEAKWERYDKRIKIVPVGSRWPVAWVDYDDVDHNEAESIARLIVAGPAMLEALEAASWLLADISPKGLIKEKVDAAIALAKGEQP